MRFWGLTAGLFFLTGFAQADVGAQCKADAARGDAARGHDLAGAVYAYRACSAPECPDEVRARCVEAHDAVAARLPTIAVVVRDARGRDVRAPRVVVDDRPATPSAGGGYVVDPGAHDVRVEGVEGLAQRVAVREGDHRRLVFLFPGAAPPARRPAWPWVVTATGGVAALTGAALTIAGFVLYDNAFSFDQAWTGVMLNHTGVGLLIGGAAVAGLGVLIHFLLPHQKPATVGLSPSPILSF
jgi:hypothetical protein